MPPDSAGAQKTVAASRPALETAIIDIEAGRRTTPLIGDITASGETTVTFVAKRIGGRVPRVVSDVTGWGERADGTFDFTIGRMTRVGRTDWYALGARVAPRARIEYLIAYGRADYRIDPHNPRRLVSPMASEFVMPDYLPPRVFADAPASPGGLVTEGSVESLALRSRVRLDVYVPPGARDVGTCPVAVFVETPPDQVVRVLDWLIAHRAIEPVVAVFADPKARGGDGRTGAAMRAFLTAELPAWLSSRFGATGGAGARAIIAISYGARDALDAAVSTADGYERLGLLIPGRRIDRAAVEAIAGGRGRPLRAAILAGQYDQANLATARRVRQALEDAGHTVDYTEVPEGHSPRTWLHHLPVVLVSLFGPGSRP